MLGLGPRASPPRTGGISALQVIPGLMLLSASPFRPCWERNPGPRPGTARALPASGHPPASPPRAFPEGPARFCPRVVLWDRRAAPCSAQAAAGSGCRGGTVSRVERVPSLLSARSAPWRLLKRQEAVQGPSNSGLGFLTRPMPHLVEGLCTCVSSYDRAKVATSPQGCEAGPTWVNKGFSSGLCSEGERKDV